MTSDKTGIAILGAGRWGIHLVRNFLAHPQAQILAVVDHRPERLSALSKRFGTHPGSDSSWDTVILAEDWSAVRRLPGLEAVVIATPAVTHYELIADALQLGYHVLAEKPLTVDPATAAELCQLAEKQHCQLVVDQTYLFHPAVERGRDVLKEGRIGDLRYGYAARTNIGPVRHDVDALWDLAIHDIAIFNSWLGATPIQVQATGTVWLQGTKQQTSQKSIVNSENTFPSPVPNLQGLADVVWLTLTYPSGFQALIHVCWLNPDKQRRLGVVGSEGTLVFDELQPQAMLTLQEGRFEETSASPYTPTNLKQEVISLPAEEPLARVCGHFLDCVQKNQPSPISSGWLGTQLVQILSGLSQSLQLGGQPVEIKKDKF